MPRSTSRSSTIRTEPRPVVTLLEGPFRAALTVDVEEWFHNCWVPEYVDPLRRFPLVEELDWLLPSLLERLERAGVRATFFVLGEVAERHPGRVREAALAGHEIACHGHAHLRANERSPAAFRADLLRAKATLESLVGQRVAGYRAPEWSLRSVANPRLRIVAECGFSYDSSLVPTVGAGSSENPIGAARLDWHDGYSLLEFPPHVWGGALRIPGGGWCARWAPGSVWKRSVQRAIAGGRLPVLVIHPWELVDRPLPGLLTGFARFFHDAGRRGFGARFAERLRGLDLRPLAAVASERSRVRGAAASRHSPAPFTGDAVVSVP